MQNYLILSYKPIRIALGSSKSTIFAVLTIFKNNIKARNWQTTNLQWIQGIPKNSICIDYRGTFFQYLQSRRHYYWKACIFWLLIVVFFSSLNSFWLQSLLWVKNWIPGFFKFLIFCIQFYPLLTKSEKIYKFLWLFFLHNLLVSGFFFNATSIVQKNWAFATYNDIF